MALPPGRVDEAISNEAKHAKKERESETIACCPHCYSKYPTRAVPLVVINTYSDKTPGLAYCPQCHTQFYYPPEKVKKP